MKTCLAQITLLFMVMLGTGSLNAQTGPLYKKEPVTEKKETPKTEKQLTAEEQKSTDAQKFDQVKQEVLQVTKELNELGVTSIPDYPKYVDLNSVTAYLEELKVLKATNLSK